MKNFLVTLNLSVLFILALAVGWLTFDDIYKTKTTQDDVRQYLLSQTNPKQPFSDEKHLKRLEKMGVLQVKETVQKNQVQYEGKLVVPSQLNLIVRKHISKEKSERFYRFQFPVFDTTK